MRDGNLFPFVCVFLLVILACKSIMLCKCSGNRIIGYKSSRLGAYPRPTSEAHEEDEQSS